MAEKFKDMVGTIISKQSACNTVYKSDRCNIDLMYCMICGSGQPISPSARYLNVMHSHSVYEFHYILNGEVEITLEDGKKIKAFKNQFIIIPPSLKHAITNESGEFKKILMSFDLDTEGNDDEFYTFVIKLMRNPVPHKGSARMTKIFNIIADMKRSDIHDKHNMIFQMIVSYIIEICNVLAEKHDIKNTKMNMDKRVEAAIRFINDNLSMPITTADVAKSLYISPKQLSRIFKDETGQTPAEYIRMSKNEHICKLLVETNLTLSDIAELVGIPDSAALIKRFKRIEGNTPIKYKKNVAGKENSHGEEK